MSWEELFIGREEELARLEFLWKKVKTGEPQIGVIIGETGLGKTRLLQEFFNMLSKELPNYGTPEAYWPNKLTSGRNLHLQPEVQNTDADIPWLWWSMRFPFSEGRNLIPYNSPFETPDSYLAANAIPILRKRKIKEAQVQALTALTSIAADLASIGLVGHALSVFDLFKAQKLARANVEKSISEILTERVRELVEKTLSTLRLFLDDERKETETVPVVLVLDDAQWIDAISLNALFLILNEAYENNWPLLVLCTHWEKEWNESPQVAIGYDFESLRQLVYYFKEKNRNSIKLLPLEKMQSSQIQRIVNNALSGIGIKVAEKVVTASDGNPRATEEMIRLLLNSPKRYFVNGDTSKALTSRGKNKVARLQSTDIYAKIMERYSELEEGLQELLSTSALFGKSFNLALVTDVVRSFDVFGLSSISESENLSLEAQSLYGLIQKISENQHEFKQAIYQQVARDYILGEFPDEISHLESLIESKTDEHLLSEEFNKREDSEKRPLLEYSLIKFIECNDFSGITTVAKSFAFEEMNWIENSDIKMTQWTHALYKKRASIPMQFFCDLNVSALAFDTLVHLDNSLSQEVGSFASEVANQCESDAISPQDYILSAYYWHSCAAHIHFEYCKNSPEAHIHYRKALDLVFKLAERDGQKEHLPKLLRTFEAMTAFGLKEKVNPESILFFSDRAIMMRKSLVEENPKSVLNINNLISGLEVRARVQYELNKDLEGARKSYLEAVKYAGILLRYSENKETIRQYARTLKGLSYIYLKERDYSLAGKYAREGLDYCTKLCMEYDPEPRSYQSMVTLLRIRGNIYHSHKKDVSSAIKCFSNADEYQDKLIAEFGCTEDRLNELCSINSNLCQFLIGNKDNQTEDVYRQVERTRRLFERLEADYTITDYDRKRVFSLDCYIKNYKGQRPEEN